MAVHSPKPAGAQLVALGQARALADDHELVIAVGVGPLRRPSPSSGRSCAGPPACRSGVPRRPAGHSHGARASPDAVRLAAIIRRRRVDGVIANSTVLVAPVLAARLAGVPVIVHAQEAPEVGGRRARSSASTARMADTVVAISPWIAEAFAGARAHVLLNPVGIRIPERPRASAAAIAARSGSSSSGRSTATSARISRWPRSRPLRRQDSTRNSSSSGPRPTPPTRRRCARWPSAPESRSACASSASRPTSPAHLLAADALLLPAGEVTPLVIMEAMVVGTPVIAARMGSITDVVLDGQSGLLVSPDDAAAMAAGIATSSRAEPPPRLADGGRARVEEHFDEARSHPRLREEIARLVAARHGGGSLAADLALFAQ